MIKSYNIVYKNGKYEIYIDGKFAGDAKTIPEAERKIKGEKPK